MNRRQFISLFLCSLIPWWVGAGLTPLLPIYTARLGAAPTIVGTYMAFVFLCLALGTALGGWLSGQRRQYREFLMLMGAIGAPATWLMGQVVELWHLLLLNAIVWFVFGATLAVVAIIAGRSAAPHERGRIFGLLAMTTALGGVLGGPTGLVVDVWGYTALFTLLACTWLVQMGAAAFLQNDQTAAVTPSLETTATRPVQLGTAFLLLLTAALLVTTGSFVGNLGRSLAMDTRGFSVTSLTLTASLNSVFGLVLNPLLGRLSDRVNRRLLLCLIYATGGLSLVLMAAVNTLLGFALVALLTAVSGAERAVSSALVSDLLPPHTLHRGLSLFDAAKWVGAVAGFAGTGYIVQFLGLSLALVVSAALPVGAILLLLLQRSDATQESFATAQFGTAAPAQPLDAAL